MRNQNLYLVGLVALLVGGCGSIQEAENGGGNPEDAPTIESVSPARVPLGGGMVTVTGTGFFSDVEVLLGTRRHTDFVVTSEEALQITIPPGTAPGETLALALFSDSGAVSMDDAVTYNSLPTIANAKPPVSPVGSGGTLTITGTLFKEDNEGPVTVRLGSTELQDVVVVDDSTITATLGPGSPELVAVAEDLVVETHNGSATRSNAHTYIGTGLLFGAPRTRNSGSIGVFDPDKGLGIYFVDPIAKRYDLAMPLKRGTGKLVRNTAGEIGVRFTENGSNPVSRTALGVVDLAEGTAEPTGILRPVGSNFDAMKIRTMTNVNGAIYAIADRETAVCCGGNTEFGTINTNTHEFTLISNAPDGLTSRACLVQSASTLLLGFNFSNSKVKVVNPATGLAVDGAAFSGDLSLPTTTETPRCHGAARIGNTVYAIQYFRDAGIARLVTVSASGLVTLVMDLPEGAGGLVAVGP